MMSDVWLFIDVSSTSVKRKVIESSLDKIMDKKIVNICWENKNRNGY